MKLSRDFWWRLGTEFLALMEEEGTLPRFVSLVEADLGISFDMDDDSLDTAMKDVEKQLADRLRQAGMLTQVSPDTMTRLRRVLYSQAFHPVPLSVTRGAVNIDTLFRILRDRKWKLQDAMLVLGRHLGKLEIYGPVTKSSQWQIQTAAELVGFYGVDPECFQDWKR